MSYDWYNIAKDFAGPAVAGFAALVAAGVTGTFAYQQWKTATFQAKIAFDKLKLDAIDDRIDVLEATRELIRYVVNLRHDQHPDTTVMQDLRYRTLKGRFLFKESVYKQIEEIVDKCFDVPNYVPEDIGTPRDETQKEMVRQRGQAKVFVIKIREKLPVLLDKEISLSLFKEEDAAHIARPVNIYRTIYLLIFSLIITIFLAFLVAIVANK